MKRAVILTGALRTIRKTIKFFKRNILNVLKPVENLDVFVCIQHDGGNTTESEWETWLSNEIGPSLKSFQWFSLKDYPDWVTHRDRQLENIAISESWKGYLRSSGSMIEYFQLQLAYMKLCNHESNGQFRYHDIIRARTDSIYAKPIDFHWLNWTEEQVETRLQIIQKEMQLSNMKMTSREILKYFMCTIISDDLIPNVPYMMAEFVPSPTEREIEMTGKIVRDYIHHGRYILTIRKNNLYIVRRELFHLIPSLGTMYGFMRSPISDGYWFNAEGQFRDACYYSCLSIFEYSTEFEEKSLVYAHEWNEANFFDLNGECVNPRMLYCVVRK